VAVKILTAGTLTPQARKDFDHEVISCSSIRSRHVVNFFGACTQGPKLAMVMELLTRGSLSGLLHNSAQDLPWPLRLNMLHEIASGIKVLHSNIPTILHRDLKAVNVLLDEHYHCKLADFGFAMVKENSTVSSTSGGGGTLAWMAPELLSTRPRFSVKSDIYAFGVIMWEVACRATPYYGAKSEVISFCVQNGEREEIPAECPKGYTELMEKCWHQNAADRPVVDDVLSELALIKHAGDVSKNSTDED